MTSYAYIDTETTGFSANDHVIQIAIVHLDGNLAVEKVWGTYLNPRLTYLPGYNIHRITPAMVASAPQLGDVADTIADLLGDRVPAAHNLDFDRRLLNANLDRVGHPFRVGDGVCTVELARQLLPKPHRNQLQALCRRFSIPLPHAHDAVADAVAGARLLKQLVAVQQRRGTATSTAAGAPSSPVPVSDWLARLIA